jgi:hypothetical protein
MMSVCSTPKEMCDGAELALAPRLTEVRLRERFVQKKLTWALGLVLLTGIAVVNSVRGQSGKPAAEHLNARAAVGQPAVAVETPIRALVSSQDAEGVTQAQMNLAFLKKFESYIVERITIKKTRESLAAAGYPDASVHFTSEATYVESGRTKLAFIRMSGQHSRSIVVAGIVGPELKRVLCIRESDVPIPVTRGACRDKIHEVFGVWLGS